MTHNFTYYDIESLENIYAIGLYTQKTNRLDIYFYLDDMNIIPTAQSIKDRIATRNRNFDTDGSNVYIWDLREPASFARLMWQMAIDYRKRGSNYVRKDNPFMTIVYKDGDEDKTIKILKPVVWDTDPEFNRDEHPFLISYNGYQYDTTIFAQTIDDFVEIDEENNLVRFREPSNDRAYNLRLFNDKLFDTYKTNMPMALTVDSAGNKDYDLIGRHLRNNMLRSGRYVDASKLNEKMYKVALKRLLGLTGNQILESNKLKPGQSRLENADEVCELIAYLASDVIQLHELMTNKIYISSFELRDAVLRDYPELIYRKAQGNGPENYVPMTADPKNVRNKWPDDRLYRDSTSAQLTTASLFPYSKVDDFKTVSYMYPAQKVVDQLNEKYKDDIEKGLRKPVRRVNVLDETKTFIYNLYSQTSDEVAQKVLNEFQPIYDYYKSLEGRNVNASERHIDKYKLFQEDVLTKLPKFERSFMHYYDKDGNPTGDYINFSVGGVHGAQWNKSYFESEMNNRREFNKLLDQLLEQYSDAVTARRAQINIIAPDGKKRGYIPLGDVLVRTGFVLKSGRRIDASQFKDKLPILESPFTTNKDGIQKLDDKYTYTTASYVNHEDFSSYYPNLLINMDVFYNTDLGYDRYNELYEQKETLGALENDMSLPADERAIAKLKRNGTKLFLNSATGGAATEYDTNIRANNAILSMRIIGQLLTTRVGIYQAYYGANIPSTNTDGLYTIMEELENNELLEKISGDINVAIEPERMFLVSKDANNRFEVITHGDKTSIIASGAVGYYYGPEPKGSLNHPAFVDKILVDYMRTIAPTYDTNLTQPFNEEAYKRIKAKYFDGLDPREKLLYYQNVLASTTDRHIFAIRDGENIAIHKYNRIFQVKPDIDGAVYLKMASMAKVSDAIANKRIKNNERVVSNDPEAVRILHEGGYFDTEMPQHEAKIGKISGVSDTLPVLIVNDSINNMTDEEANALLAKLDDDVYMNMVKTSYEELWRNKLEAPSLVKEIDIIPNPEAQSWHTF